MKKVLAILAVLALAAPAMAQDAVTITTATAPGTLTINWATTGTPVNGGPVGFALAVNCSAGQVTAINSVSSFFDVFIDFAYDEETTGDGYSPYGEGKTVLSNIAADPANPGVIALPSSDFVLSFAGLGGASGTPAAAPLTGSIVLAVTPATGATLTIDVDDIRGGIVNKGGAMTVTGLPTGSIVVPPLVTDCLTVGQVFTYAGPGPAYNLTVTQAMVDRWVTYGKPACWCCLAQKVGNIITTNGNATLNTADLNALRGSYGKVLGQSGFNACADSNLDGAVNTNDLNRFRAHYGLTVGACQ